MKDTLQDSTCVPRDRSYGAASRRVRSIIGVVLTVAISSSVRAEEPRAVYLGASLGRAHYTYDTGWPQCTVCSPIEIWTSGSAKRLTAGMRLSERWGVELSHFDLGRSSRQEFDFRLRSEVASIDVALLGRVPYRCVELFAKAGVAYSGTYTVFREGRACIPEDPCGSWIVGSELVWELSYLAGVGIEKRFGNLGLRAEYE